MSRRRFVLPVILSVGLASGGAIRAAPSAAESGADIRLPAGEGRRILREACTGCHDLDGLAAFKGYYTKARWRELVETMINHGAELNAEERTAVTDYLAEHFGPAAR